MRDSDIDSLSADGAQDSSRIMSSDEMAATDPRAALAEALALKGMRLSQIEAIAAERGVRLVTEERLRAAIHDTPKSDYPGEAEWVAAIFAALSCRHPDGAIRAMAPTFKDEWACTNCGQRFMPVNADD